VSNPESSSLETDPRFPSGPWVGFFLQKEMPGRHMMEIGLTFANGQLKGEGRDVVGRFTMRGSYSLTDGKCHWTKHYINQHDVSYQGFNEGKGIWGIWEIRQAGLSYVLRGGFHIWPKGMADPSSDHLAEEADQAAFVEDTLETSEPIMGRHGQF
jgi:hypothetical protein